MQSSSGMGQVTGTWPALCSWLPGSGFHVKHAAGGWGFGHGFSACTELGSWPRPLHLIAGTNQLAVTNSVHGVIAMNSIVPVLRPLAQKACLPGFQFWLLYLAVVCPWASCLTPWPQVPYL